MASLAQKAELLRSLHHQSQPLVLANAWDVASARIVEKAGFPAIATTSAGIAVASGYPDGEQISRGEMLRMVSRIAGAVAVPVTADMEAGYGDTADEMENTINELLEAGAVGLNLEDGLSGHAPGLAELPHQCEKIKALRRAGKAAGVPVVINARTDGFLNRVGDEKDRLAEAIQRGHAYREAGADCIFIPGVSDTGTIEKLVESIGGPINILAVPGSPSIAELQRLGVKRISLGSGPHRATLGLLQKIAEELKTSGTYSTVASHALSYADAQRLVARKP
jgi:2-methylisocitrate lyase-like PEP mutase family enzyme